MNPEDQEKERMQKRLDDADAELQKALTKIFRKAHHELTIEDKAFLQARRSYLTQAQTEEYDSELNEKLPRPDGQDEDEATDLQHMTRANLNIMAADLGIETPEDKKVYKTNQDLIDAIEAKQKEASEQE